MSRAVFALNYINTVNTLNTFRRLPPELRSIALASTRPCPTTTANWSRGYSSVKVLRLQGAQKQKEVASPLSPLSNPSSLKTARRRETPKKQPLARPPATTAPIETSKKKKARWEHGRNGAFPQPTASTPFSPQSPSRIQSRQSRPAISATASSTHKPRKERKKNVALPPARPSKGVDGVSTTRTLLIQPATNRPSRVPVWARPASSNFKNRRDKRKLAPSGVTWSEHIRKLRDQYGKWRPEKKISHDAMDGLRLLHRTDPQKYSLLVLAQRFKISREAVRRILKSKWRLSPQEREGKLVRERKRRAERLQMMKQAEMHQMVMAGIKLKVHPDDKLQLR